MSNALYSLNAYGHVLEAWLEDSLDSIHLSSLPRLTWFDSANAASNDAQNLFLNFTLSKTPLFDTTGGFTGNLTLTTADGSNLSSRIVAATADPYNFDNPDRYNDSLIIELSSPLPDGATLQLDFNRDGNTDLKIGPLLYEDIPYADAWQDEAFQLDLISEGTQVTVPGKEAAAEGWLDLDQNRVVLLGNGLPLQDNALVQFGYDQALPDNLDSWLTYSIDDLQTIEGGLSFQLRDANTNKLVSFGVSNGISDSSTPFGIRLALAQLENKLVFDDLHSSESQRIPLDPAVLDDLRVQIRDQEAAANTPWSNWTDIPVASATAAWSELRLTLDRTNEQSSIPADWQVRLSYDDLLQETIGAAELETGLYLQLDQVLIAEVMSALADQGISGASLSLGPAGTDAYHGYDLSTYLTSADLYTAIASASWAASLVDPDAGILQLQALASGQDLANFQVQFNVVHESGGAPEPIYNAAQFLADAEGAWVPADPDGFSLWKEWSGGPVAIDRYGDQLDRLGNQPAGAEPPNWSDYHPWISINSDWFKPWDEQRTSPKTIEIEGNNFDGGDDLIIHLSLELPDDPLTPEWEGEWRDYVLLFDLYTDNDSQLTGSERDILFEQELYDGINALSYDPRFSVDVEIGSGGSLSGSELIDTVASGLTAFLASLETDIQGFFASGGFTLSTPTFEDKDGRNVLEATLDFPAPSGGSKPSVNLWARVLDDPSNSTAYDAAWQEYSNYTASDAQEWLNNYGSSQPRFHSAWTNPLEDDEPSTRTVTLDYNGLDPLAELYAPGDLLLSLNNKLVDPNLYSVENLWGYQLQIILSSDSGLQLTADSEVSISLRDNHSFVDTAGNRLANTTLAVDNWAAWQSYGFNLNEQLFLDQDNSYVDDKTIRLSFFGSADLSLDANKAITPQTTDFQFWAFDINTGETRELTLATNNPLKVDGKALVFTLANPVGSDVNVDVTYDPLLDSSEAEAFTNTKGVEAQAFYWQPLDNRSPDKQGPSISWSSVWGNQLMLGLTDPAGIWVGDQELSSSNLPAPSDFLIKATDSTGTSRTITGTSINLAAWGWNELELQLDSTVKPGEKLSLSYQGSSLQDGNGNPATLRQVPINNETIAYDANDAGSWFQSNDRIKVVFDDAAGTGGIYRMENGSVSSSADNFQIQDDYTFSLSGLSQISVDLTDRAGGTLDDNGDANLDFSLENLKTQDFIGGSWNSLMDSWLGSDATNDERGVKFVLPAGDYRLSVMHADLWQESTQSYQLQITHSPYTLENATQLDTSESQLVVQSSVPLSNDGNSTGSDASIFLDLQDAGQVTAELNRLDTASWLDLYDLNGLWIGSSYGHSLSQYVLPGLYRLELGTWSTWPSDTELSVQLDSSIKLAVDTDSREAPSGSISVNGLPSKGELNLLDREDFWTLKLNGGQIYTLRASGFSDDVNLIVNDAEGFWVADSWNWGTYADDGTFIPSDETVVLDLSGKPTGTYAFTVQPQTWSNTSTSYTLLANSHATLDDAQAEAARGVVNYDSLYDDYFGGESDLATSIDFNKDDLQELTALQEVSSEKLRELKASLEKNGLDPSGNVLALKTTLSQTSSNNEPSPLLISKSVPHSLPDETRNKLADSEPGELSEHQSQPQFGPKQIAQLASDTKDEATALEPVSKPVGIKVESRNRRLGGFLAEESTSNQLISGPGLAAELESYDLGLQRIIIPLDQAARTALGDPENSSKTLIWYKTPASSDAWLFTYDETTGTGSRLEETDSTQDGPDVMALYIQDGGRGDDDGRVNGEIVAPGGLALAQLLTQDPLIDWNADIDGDSLFSPLSDGLAITRRFSRPDLSEDPLISSYATPGSPRSAAGEMLARIDAGFNDGRFDLDGSGNTDINDLSLALRHGFGTFPGQALTAGLEIAPSTTLSQLNERLSQLSSTANIQI